MAIQKKKTTPVAQKSKSKNAVPKKIAAAQKASVTKSGAKKAAAKKVVPQKATAKKVVSKKAVTAKVPAKKVAAKKIPVTKKGIAKKVVSLKKAASKLSPVKKITKPIIKKSSPVKKTAKAGVKKAVFKKLATPKKTSVKNSAEVKKTAPKVVAKKTAMTKPVKKNSAEKELASKHEINHKTELKKALLKVKAKNEESQKREKPFVMPKTSTEKARKYEPEFIKSVLDQSPQEPNGPTMRYSDSELLEFRELISRKLETAKKELGYLQGLITRKDQMGGDDTDNRYMTMEDGSLSMEREQLSQMASRQITFIDHLEKAMMRIENKTYGICRVTGKLIDKARLRAVPHATLSIEAKMGITR